MLPEYLHVQNVLVLISNSIENKVGYRITDQKSFYLVLESIALIFIITQDVYFGCEWFRLFFPYCCWVAQLCPTLCHLMEYSLLGFPVLHHLLEFAQTHVRWISDAIQPSHPLSSSLPSFSLSQHKGLFQWASSLH